MSTAENYQITTVELDRKFDELHKLMDDLGELAHRGLPSAERGLGTPSQTPEKP